MASRGIDVQAYRFKREGRKLKEEAVEEEEKEEG